MLQKWYLLMSLKRKLLRQKLILDRSIQPPVGPDPEVTIPPVWTESLANGMKIWGIEQNELPLVQYQIVIDGGHMVENIAKPGVANLMATLMNEGTFKRSPEELGRGNRLLGASISISAGTESITVSVSTLVGKFDETLNLLKRCCLSQDGMKSNLCLPNKG